MDKQNNSNLDALLNNLIENFGEDDPVTQKVESLMEENVNLLLVGATGSGKSSTINAMFNMQVAKVGVGVDPETACIEKYELGGLTIWDTTVWSATSKLLQPSKLNWRKPMRTTARLSTWC